VRISTTSSVDQRTRKAVFAGLLEFNQRFAKRNHKDFTITARDGRRIIGGAIGESKFDWLFVQLLWVDESSRHGGVGSRLMAEVEVLAKRRKCAGVFLDTFSFQAPRFYAKLGYRRIGTLAGCPRGYAKYWYAKVLSG
jgi:N-acetylglutamate synthase-like GNAT family acetyltransferase